jgi:hypothetical protein
MGEVLAIDPTGCGCTECLVGEYVPFDRATRKQLKQMRKGKIGNNTYLSDAAIKARIILLEEDQ